VEESSGLLEFCCLSDPAESMAKSMNRRPGKRTIGSGMTHSGDDELTTVSGVSHPSPLPPARLLLLSRRMEQLELLRLLRDA
jgi:hypothetical protein